MEYADHVDAVIEWRVEDDVAPERTAAHAGCKFVAGSPHQGLRRKQVELLIQPIDPPIRRGQAVIGNVVPDLGDAGRSQRAGA